MTDDDVSGVEPDVERELGAMLARPEIWDDPPPDLEERVVAAIGAARSGVVSPARRPGRRLALVAAAAALVVVATLGVLLVGNGDDAGDGVVVALAGTELAPGASATADISATPLGVKILLDVRGLPGAPPGSYYEAWLRNPTDGVSAGTFHLRGGPGTIELWCGVDDPAYSTITVTLQQEGEGAASSGRVVLTGQR